MESTTFSDLSIVRFKISRLVDCRIFRFFDSVHFFDFFVCVFFCSVSFLDVLNFRCEIFHCWHNNRVHHGTDTRTAQTHTSTFITQQHRSTARGTRHTAHGTQTHTHTHSQDTREAPTHHTQRHDQEHRAQHSTKTSTAQTTKPKHDTRQTERRRNEKKRRIALSETPCVSLFHVCEWFVGQRG